MNRKTQKVVMGAARLRRGSSHFLHAVMENLIQLLPSGIDCTNLVKVDRDGGTERYTCASTAVRDQDHTSGEKTQRGAAEYFGFRAKYVGKKPLTRERRKRRKMEAGNIPRPKGRPRKEAVLRNIVTADDRLICALLQSCAH